jgi:hypothetical protein
MTAVRRLRPLLVLMIVPLALLSLRETSLVSACSGRGGHYDHATRHCDAASFQADDDSAPPLQRDQVLLGAVLVAAAGAAVAGYLHRSAVRKREQSA